MNHLLILCVLAVLPVMESQTITSMGACTTKTNDLRVNCHYKKQGSAAINYEWSLRADKAQVKVIASTINPDQVDSTFKNRAKVNQTEAQVQLTLTGFGTADDGKYACRLRSVQEPHNDNNKTISVVKAVVCCTVPTVGLELHYLEKSLRVRLCQFVITILVGSI
ncbi:thy-1 membrane glycoprotein-like [Heptranchias perlo]|uniref:thy-1 membrane glycoprotein-like n=1 Tax=Heptranchias perlo TaxID=212740 RepID=UPI00355993C0